MGRSSLFASELLTENFIIKLTKWQWFYIIATVVTAATIFYLNNKQENLDEKIQKVKNAGVKIEQQRLQEQKKTIEEQKAREEQYKQEINKQIEDLRKQVEAKKASKLAQAAQAVASRAIPTAYAGSHQDWLRAAGIAESEWASVDYIVSRESGWNPNAVNRSSGAEGLVQALPYSKTGCAHGDPICQLRWASVYAQSRYGGWSGAYTFWVANHWW